MILRSSSKTEINPSFLSEHDDDEAGMPYDDDDDDDDDDIFCFRAPQHSSLHHEKENKIITKKIFSSDLQNISPPRSASGNNVSGLTGKSEHCRNVKTVFRDGSSHSATETPHLSVELGHNGIRNIITDDDKNPAWKHILTVCRKVTRSSNHSVGLGYTEYECDKADDGETTRKGFFLTKRKRKLETSNHLTESCCVKNDSDNPSKENRVKTGTATSNQIHSELGENGDIADGNICISSNEGGGGGSSGKENVSSKWKRWEKLSDHLIGSDYDKTECIVTYDEYPNKENVTTRRKRQTKASNSAVGSKHVENEADTSSGENPQKKNLLHKTERQTKTSNHVFALGPDRNESMFSAGRKRAGRPNYNENENYEGIFYKTCKCSLFDDKGKKITHSICGKENFTLPKLSKTNKFKSLSESMLTRNGISTETLKCPVKPAALEKENTVDSHYSSDESSIGTENLFTYSYRKQFSGGVMEEGASSDKSDNIYRLKKKSKLSGSTAETKMVPSVGSELLKNERELSDDDDDDDIFYRTPRHLLFREKEKEGMGKIRGNENVTSQKSSKTNYYKSFKNNSSQSTQTVNNIYREALRHPVKPMVFENENTVDSDYNGDESSMEIEDSLTDSYRHQFSEDVVEKTASRDKSEDNIRQKIESKLKSSNAEMQKGHLPTSKCLENEKQVIGHDDDDDDDIFCYRKRKQSPCYEKENNR
jgi:hypothetical protein